VAARGAKAATPAAPRRAARSLRARSKPPRLEKHLEARCRLIAIKDYKATVLKLWPTAKGLPDRLFLLPGGLPVFVEFKLGGAAVSPAQVFWLRRLRSLGFIAHVVRDSGHFADVMEVATRANEKRLDAEGPLVKRVGP
jgi:hypothetical protein